MAFGVGPAIRPEGLVGGNFAPAGSLIRCARGHVVCEAARDLIGPELNTWHDAFANWRQRPKQLGDPPACEHDGCGHFVDFADWHPAKLYARAGEVVTCEGDNHLICTVAVDLFLGDRRDYAGQFRDWTLRRLPSPERPMPRCPVCRSAWVQGSFGQPGVLHFASGWRMDLTLADGRLVIRDLARRFEQIIGPGSFEQQTGYSGVTGEAV